jgi:hypothetical protein
MARGDINQILNVETGEVVAQVEGEGPIDHLERRFKENVHQANRQAKKILKRKVTQKLRRGVEGEEYDENYAGEKRAQTGRLYGATGPVDFRYSGRLWNELVGRGRAKPSEPSLQVWLGLRHPNRERPESAPGGGGITYKELTQVLRGEKPGPEGDPFSPSDKGREEMARGVADRLMGVD